MTSNRSIGQKSREQGEEAPKVFVDRWKSTYLQVTKSVDLNPYTFHLRRLSKIDLAKHLFDESHRVVQQESEEIQQA